MNFFKSKLVFDHQTTLTSYIIPIIIVAKSGIYLRIYVLYSVITIVLTPPPPSI